MFKPFMYAGFLVGLIVVTITPDVLWFERTAIWLPWKISLGSAIFVYFHSVWLIHRAGVQIPALWMMLGADVGASLNWLAFLLICLLGIDVNRPDFSTTIYTNDLELFADTMALAVMGYLVALIAYDVRQLIAVERNI